MQEKHQARGLVLIGIHCQNVPKEKVLALCSQHKINYSIFGSGKVKGEEFRGIPKVFLFNWKGEMTWDGRHSGLEDAVEEVLKGAPDWLVGPRKFEKVKAEAGKIRKRKGMGGAVKALREKAKSEDAQEKEEAEVLLGRVVKYAERQMQRAEACIEAGDPLKAQAIWKDLAKAFKGDEIGDKAASIEKEKGKDAAFKKELSAAKKLAGIERMAEKIESPRRGEDLDKWRDKNAGALKRILAMVKGLEKKFGDTKVMARAKALLKSLHLE
ncbi:MAG: hypothetical protein ACYTHN_06505 [Planctomycetota bacterium]|jgi:hypothetical protein